MKMSLRVAALYVSTQKTLAFGLPIIKTLFGSSPSTATVIAPLLIYHPLQLFVGSILAPSFKRMIQHDESESK
jgi:sodium/bile acid cotransporter 7